MSGRYFHTSTTRISDLEEAEFVVEALPRADWGNGDYVIVEVASTSSGQQIELASGRMIEVAEGDLAVGALGRRHATLEATGTWEEVGEDGRMHFLTGAGLLGKCTSRSMMLSPLTVAHYRGHVHLHGHPVGMADYALPATDLPYEIPTVLLVGTSMSAGKTTAARIVIRELKRAGLEVIGAKLTGAGRYRDVLTMGDAGADQIFDFMDAGLPSTICPEDAYRDALRALLGRMAETGADVAVVEVGASPLEPYNGATAIEKIREHVRLTILCSLDPYAVLGVMSAYDSRPDLVTGVATNTRAGVELVEKLSGVPALNIRDKESRPALREILDRHLSGEPGAA